VRVPSGGSGNSGRECCPVILPKCRLLDRKYISSKTKYWKKEIIIFGLYVQEEEIHVVEGNENFYNHSQEMLNKTKKK